VVESVTRAFTAGREFVDQFVELARPLGYSASHLLIDAKWLGVPQTRKRYFMVLHKNEFSLPAPNWAPPKTAAEALLEVNDPGYVGQLTDPVQQQMLPTLKPGQAMRPLWERRDAGDRGTGGSPGRGARTA
jgi:site-specific DNA-cytosine methylase